MENPGAFLLAFTLHALTVFSMLAVLLLNSEAADGCSTIPACGHVQDIRYPFRLRGDPPECGVKSCELLCQDGKAIIHIETGRYFVTDISYNESIFWVVKADLDNGVCPLPSHWSQQPNRYFSSKRSIELYPDAAKWVSLVSCLWIITNNSMYSPVACLRANNYSVHLLTTEVANLEPSCGCLAIIPLGGPNMTKVPNSFVNYADVLKFMRSGFAVRFPFTSGFLGNFEVCLTIPYVSFPGMFSISMTAIGIAFDRFWRCTFGGLELPSYWNFVIWPVTWIANSIFGTS